MKIYCFEIKKKCKNQDQLHYKQKKIIQQGYHTNFKVCFFCKTLPFSEVRLAYGAKQFQINYKFHKAKLKPST